MECESAIQLVLGSAGEYCVKTGPRSHWSLLVTYLKPLWLGFLLLGVLVLASIALQLAIPQIVRHLIDTARSGEEPRRLSRAALRFLGAALGNQALSMAAVYLAKPSPGRLPTRCELTWCSTASAWTCPSTRRTHPAS